MDGGYDGRQLWVVLAVGSGSGCERSFPPQRTAEPRSATNIANIVCRSTAVLSLCVAMPGCPRHQPDSRPPPHAAESLPRRASDKVPAKQQRAFKGS
eukprot:1212542-Alexandrium_andersonii.AAC.1